MPHIIDITGQRFSMLKVIRLSNFRGNNGKEIFFDCECDCGNKKTIRSLALRTGITRSCGCLSLDNRFQVKHNMCFTREYKCWASMKKRCNGNEKRYNSYVDNGVTVCDEWINDFGRFYSDMGNAPTRKHTIDRIDNSKGYSKENCRWATQKQQNMNYSQNKFLTYNNETLCVTSWAEKLGIDRFLIYNRLQKGWSVEKALTPKLLGRGGKRKTSP